MDLIKIYEQNEKERKEYEKAKKKANIKKEVKKFVASIIEGSGYYYTNDKDFIKELNLSFKKSNYSSFYIGHCDYEIKINKTNINKVQQYIDEKGI